jgi:hypothetical protein
LVTAAVVPTSACSTAVFAADPGAAVGLGVGFGVGAGFAPASDFAAAVGLGVGFVVGFGVGLRVGALRSSALDRRTCNRPQQQVKGSAAAAAGHLMDARAHWNAESYTRCVRRSPW